MSVTLVENGYGKSGIRLVKVVRNGARHELHDLTVSVRLEGDFLAAHRDGDNRAVLPTDTMKNTVYALAHRNRVDEPEAFGQLLATHFLAACPAAAHAVVELEVHSWSRLPVAGEPHEHAFARGSPERRTARMSSTRERTVVESGIAGLVLLKTTRSSFEDFLRDEFTTLPDTSERILATSLTAWWSAAAGEARDDGAWTRSFERVRTALVETFAGHDSRSVQHTLYAMGEAVLERIPEVREIRMSMPNIHHLLVDLSPFGQQNRNEIFVATEAPYGMIEATLSRGGDGAQHR